MAQTAAPREAAIQQALILVEVSNVDPEEPDCGICLQSYQHPTQPVSGNLPQEPRLQEYPAELQCGHRFGHLCITAWLKISELCPKCKFRTLPFSPSERAYIEAESWQQVRSTFDIGVQSWDESRTGYLNRLWNMAAAAEFGTGVFEAATDALAFIYDQTSHTLTPDLTLQFVVREITIKPALLSDERYHTARYYQSCRVAHRIPDHARLETLIREDFTVSSILVLSPTHTILLLRSRADFCTKSDMNRVFGRN